MKGTAPALACERASRKLVATWYSICEEDARRCIVRSHKYRYSLGDTCLAGNEFQWGTSHEGKVMGCISEVRTYPANFWTSSSS